MKITDLLDHYTADFMPFPAVDTPDAEATITRTMEKLALTPRRRRIPLKALLAACLTIILTATAAAVGFTLWERARQDAGLASGDTISEYVEYKDLPTISTDNPLENDAITEVADASIELVSTICTGQNVTAYLRVSPASETSEDCGWDIGGKPEAGGVSEIDGFYLFGIRQLSYDAATKSALICMELRGAIFEAAESFSMDLFRNEADSVLHYGRFTLPITPSETVRFPVALPLENGFIPETATLTEVAVGASFVRFTMDNPQDFAQWCEENGGEDAWFKMGDAYWGYFDRAAGLQPAEAYTELDAQVAYTRSWSGAISDMAHTSAVVLLDGSEISLDGAQSSLRDNNDAVSWMTEDFTLPALVDLSQVAGIRIGEAYFPVASVPAA